MRHAKSVTDKSRTSRHREASGRKPAGAGRKRAGIASDWKLRFAVPLGFPGTDRPYFLETLGTTDPVEQIRHIASLGLAGVQDNNLRVRPRSEQQRIGSALARHGLEMGCFVSNPPRDLYWGKKDAATADAIRKEILAVIEAAKRVGGKNVVINSPRDARLPLWYELANLVDNLRRVVELAEKAAIVLCLEHVNLPRMPGMLLHHLGDSYAVVRAIDSPAVKLVFDTTHVQIMDGDLSGNLARVGPEIGAIQVADVPNRLEPGTGEINFVNLFRQIRDSGYQGLVEMEHHFSLPGRAGEEAALRALRQINAAM